MALLQEKLDEITANTRQLVQADRLAIGEKAIVELFATGIEDGILPVGATAPDFALPDSSGKLISLDDVLSFGPLILKFFRGRWCPYCVTELESWSNLYSEVRASGAFLIAVGPQTQRQSDFMVGQHNLPFAVLTDPACELAEKFHLAYTVPQYHQEYYRSILINIPFVNGESSWRLPLPATYVISPDRKILFAEAHADFRVRPEPSDVLRELFQYSHRSL